MINLALQRDHRARVDIPAVVKLQRLLLRLVCCGPGWVLGAVVEFFGRIEVFVLSRVWRDARTRDARFFFVMLTFANPTFPPNSVFPELTFLITKMWGANIQCRLSVTNIKKSVTSGLAPAKLGG